MTGNFGNDKSGSGAWKYFPTLLSRGEIVLLQQWPVATITVLIIILQA